MNERVSVVFTKLSFYQPTIQEALHKIRDNALADKTSETQDLSSISLAYSSFHLDKPQIQVGAVRELPLRYGLPIKKWL